MARKWVKFPHADKAYVHDAAGLKKHWARLHKGDCEPFPEGRRGARGVAALPRRRFRPGGRGGPRRRRRRRQRRGRRRRSIYANYLEKSRQGEARAARGGRRAGPTSAARAAPKDANAHYLYAYALGRYSQGISVAKALAQGYGGKIKDALLTALKLEPKHADAHTAYGAYQAEVIDKVGGLVGGMTYGAKKDSARRALREGAEALPRIGDRAHRVRERPASCCSARAGSPRRRKLYEEAAALQAGRRDGAPRRRAREVGARIAAPRTARLAGSSA